MWELGEGDVKVSKFGQIESIGVRENISIEQGSERERADWKSKWREGVLSEEAAIAGRWV